VSRLREIARHKQLMAKLAMRAREKQKRLRAERLLERFEAANGGMKFVWYLTDLEGLLGVHRDTAKSQFERHLVRPHGRWCIERDNLIAALRSALTESPFGRALVRRMS